MNNTEKGSEERRAEDRANGGSEPEIAFLKARRRVIYSALALALLLSSAIATSLWINYQKILGEEEGRLRDLANGFSQSFSLSVKSISSVLNLFADNVGLYQGDLSGELEKRLVQLRAENPFINDLILVDKQGWVTIDARQPNSPKTKDINVSDRDYFLVHAIKPAAELFFGQPTINRRHGGQVIPISIGIYDRAGKWQGVVALSIDQEYFSTLFSTLVGSGHYQGLVVGEQGVIYARFPQNYFEGIERWIPEPEVESLLPNQEAGGFTGVPFTGAGEQLLYYRSVDGSSFRLLFGIDRPRALDPFSHSLHASIGVLVGGLILILIGAVLEFRRWASLLSQAGDLDKRLKFESLLRSISVELINIPIDELAESLSRAIGRLGEFNHLAACAVFEYSSDRDRLACRYLWLVDRPQANLQKVPTPERSGYKWLFENLDRGDEIRISSLEDVPIDAIKEREFYLQMKNRSLVLTPFFIQAQVAGFITSVIEVSGQIWSDRDNSQRALAAQVIANGVARLHHGRALEQQNKFDELIAEIAKDLISVDPGTMDRVFDQSLQKIGQFIEADRGFICQFLEQRGELVYTHEWRSSDTIPSIKGETSFHREELPYVFSDQMKAPLLLEDIEQLPSQAEKEKRYLESIGVTAIARVPLILGGEIKGFLGFDEPGEEHRSLDYVGPRLTLIGQLFSAIFLRQQGEESISRLVEILEGTSDLVGTATREGEVIYLNQAGRELLGIGLGEPLTGVKAWDFYDPAQFPDIEGIKNSGAWRGEAEFFARNGARIPVSQVIIFRSGDSPTGGYFSIIARDISEQQTQERERGHLEAQVRQLQKLEAIGTLAGGIAHDFNNILAAAFGHLQLAEAKLEPNHPALGHVQETQKAASRARDLVRQILTFSRQDEAQRELVLIGPLVRETLALIRASLPANIDIVEEIDTVAQPVMADASQLHQVILNLCANAAQSMPTGGTLEIGLRHLSLPDGLECTTGQLPAGDYYQLKVRDSGEGIDPADLERIFDPFYTSKGVNEGTGLGLSTVHGVVTAHHGGIVVESEPGVGSSFVVYLPVSEVLPASPQAEESVSRLEEKNVPTGQGQRILFVDDEPMLVSLAEELIGQLGYQVESFEGAESALKYFQEASGDFDLVMTDMSMPGMNGRELAEKIKKTRPDIPIVLLSGFIEEGIEVDTEGSVVNAILQKPVSLADLATVITSVLEEGSLH